jgi:hypothetical protein
MRRGARTGLLVLVTAAAASPAAPAAEIPEDPATGNVPVFIGSQWTPQPVSSPDPPRHPFMAPNGKSNLHEDGYQTDTHQGIGPVGNQMLRRSTFYANVCASITFDSRGRIVTVCVGLTNATLRLLDPETLEELASMSLPNRVPGANVFQDFAGGGYFYLDHRDRAVIPTNDRRIFVVAQTGGRGTDGFRIERTHDLNGPLAPSDKIISALPDWSGRLWVASVNGIVATVDQSTGVIRSHNMGEGNQNSFAVDDIGGVFFVSDRALYRFDAAPDGTPKVTWREPYANTGIQKPGQAQAGSGTTPTMMGRDLVSITDNADPMNILVYKRARTVSGPRLVCGHPVFERGASATDQSLIATPTSMVVENNYGYTGPNSTTNGAVTSPGLERIDVDPAKRTCRRVWRSNERAPSVVPKLSLATGLVYTYTKEPGSDDPWYLAAIDFRTGRTAFKRLAGMGLGYNNNYAPITIGPTGHLYVGTLGGMVMLRDATPAVVPAVARRRVRMSVRLSWLSGRVGGRRCARSRLRIRATGAGRGSVRHVDFFLGSRRLARDSRPAYTAAIPLRGLRSGRVYAVKATIRLYGLPTRTVVRFFRAC